MKTTASSTDIPGPKNCFGCPLKTSCGSDQLVPSMTEDVQPLANPSADSHKYRKVDQHLMAGEKRALRGETWLSLPERQEVFLIPWPGRGIGPSQF